MIVQAGAAGERHGFGQRGGRASGEGAGGWLGIAVPFVQFT
jgi:hypothetical protein